MMFFLSLQHFVYTVDLCERQWDVDDLWCWTADCFLPSDLSSTNLQPGWHLLQANLDLVFNGISCDIRRLPHFSEARDWAGWNQFVKISRHDMQEEMHSYGFVVSSITSIFFWLHLSVVVLKSAIVLVVFCQW